MVDWDPVVHVLEMEEDDWFDGIVDMSGSGAAVPDNFRSIISAQMGILDPMDIETLSVEEASRIETEFPSFSEVYTEFINILEECRIEYMMITDSQEYEEYRSTIEQSKPVSIVEPQPIERNQPKFNYSFNGPREILSHMIDDSTVGILMECTDNDGNYLLGDGSEELAFEIISEIKRKEHASIRMMNELELPQEDINENTRMLKITILREVIEILKDPKGYSDWREAMRALPSFKKMREDSESELAELRFKSIFKSSGKPCVKCKSTDTLVMEKQTRSGDEGVTLFYSCQSCDKKWRENA